ncbi:hypothetical protein P171DRAFT_348345 [Karstenula rhodostoma CBS 690.94]|uniref:HNH nuclease domain-containing protein n=1 Tax=Karstenula rhodostoma CBS 690.94 TaxID=1392251 RepID=A0A9P4PSF0_9PLEO|nr:hypothetical protein P171DRAFT_348345 [Karstenula rhodostoma CBS 690.94]
MSTSSWTDCCPEQGDESYSERSTERRQVFEDAASRLDTGVPPSIWAFLQVADLDQVKQITHSKFSWNTMKEGQWLVYSRKVKDALLLWKQRPEDKEMDDTAPAPKRTHSRAFSTSTLSQSQSNRSQIPASKTRTRSGRPLGAPEGSVRRDVMIAKHSKERDGNLCVISRIGAAQACYIYPWCAFGAQSSDRVANFWKVLEMFWPEDKVDAWRAKIFHKNGMPYGTETVENMITFTATLHNFHTEGAFALRPIRITADKTQLELEFHWLKRQVRDSKKPVDLLDLPMSSRDLLTSEHGQCFCYMDNGAPTQLVSGQKFTMKTDDPVRMPLPDPGLLELQWHLQRIMAMSGAAGWKEDDFGGDDDDDDSDPAEDFVQRWIDETHEFRQDWSPSKDGSVGNGDGAYD